MFIYTSNILLLISNTGSTKCKTWLVGTYKTYGWTSVTATEFGGFVAVLSKIFRKKVFFPRKSPTKWGKVQVVLGEMKVSPRMIRVSEKVHLHFGEEKFYLLLNHLSARQLRKVHARSWPEIMSGTGDVSTKSTRLPTIRVLTAKQPTALLRTDTSYTKMRSHPLSATNKSF